MIGVVGSMDAIINDIFPASRIGYPVIFARFLGAILFGGLIGFEREAKDRPAGLKTHILVSLAACVFAVVALESIHLRGFEDETVRVDPLRVIEAVTAGVAFLAAGTIVLSRGEIHGITTGASLWLAGAIGVSLGFGQWIIAFAAVIGGFLILLLVGKIEDKVKSSDGMKIANDKPPHGDPPKGEA
jgi:putative Mg2+ transporter-C (MgtC) family protein